MAEYIEREAARTLFAGYGSTDQFDALLDTIPTADAVPVVRCKDCFYYQNDRSCGMNGTRWWAHDDYCSYGKPKEATP